MVRVKNLGGGFECQNCGDADLDLSVHFGKQKISVSYVCPTCVWCMDVCEIEVLDDESIQ